jgi:hydrogenase expression/formation protein HypC
MCLGVPGKVLEITPSPVGMTMGKVSFGGVAKEVCLAYTPEVEVGDYVIVHAGFALNRLDEEEAAEVFAILREMGEVDELLASGDASLPASINAGTGRSATS